MDLSKMEMKIYKLKDLLNRVSNPVEIENSTLYTQIGIRSHAKGVFIKEPVTGLSLGNKRVFWIEPDCLIVNIVFAWERAIAKTTSELEGYIVSHRFPMYKTNEKADLDYLLHYLSTLRGKKILEDASPGGAGRNKTLSQKDFLESKIKLPSFKVQKYISGFLKLLDKKIQLQQQKIDLLQEQKKGFMQKIFKQEWRFKEFTQQWKTTTIGSLAEISRGASPRPIQDPKWFDGNSNVGWLRISDVTKQNGRIHYLEQKISILGQEKTRVLETPHLLLSIAATVGKPVINYIPTGVHDGFLIFYNPTFNVEFMFQWLEMFRDNWQKYGQPGSQVNLNSELVKNQEISIPVIEEQQKIAEFLTLMDKKIQLQKEKLELLKKQKQGFMQQMFI